MPFFLLFYGQLGCDGVDCISTGILDLAAVKVAVVAILAGESKGCLGSGAGNTVLPGHAAIRGYLPLINLACTGGLDGELKELLHTVLL